MGKIDDRAPLTLDGFKSTSASGDGLKSLGFCSVNNMYST
jgi:hypothetical protein